MKVVPAAGTKGITVTETAPSGWTILSANPQWAKHADPVTYTWLLFDTAGVAPFTITYTLKATDTARGVCDLAGTIRTSAEGLIPTRGDNVLSDGSPVLSQVSCGQGWTPFSLPVDIALSAQGLLDLVRSQGGAPLEVAEWTGTEWRSHPDGVAFNNFQIRPGKGYFLRCASACTITLTGPLLISVVLALQEGWNLVGLPAGSYTAQSVADIVNSQSGGCAEIAQKDGANWTVFSAGSGGDGFAVVSGRGYFIRCSRQSVAEF